MTSRLSHLSPWIVVLVLFAWPAASMARPLSPPWLPTTPFSSETAAITISGHLVDAEIADTGELRERGLSYRDGLRPGTGMLFIYEDASTRSFWMYEMRFCLDILWITDGRLVGAAENSCPAERSGDDIPRFRSPEPVQYVLEVDAGWMAANGVDAGADVEIVLPGSVSGTS